MTSDEQVNENLRRVDKALEKMADAITDLTSHLAKAEARHEAHEQRMDDQDKDLSKHADRISQNEKDVAGIVPIVDGVKKLMWGVMAGIILLGAKLLFT